MSIKHDEQWLSNGNCEKCRRQKYCSKSCTARKARQNDMLKNAILKATKLDKIFEMYGKVRTWYENIIGIVISVVIMQDENSSTSKTILFVQNVSIGTKRKWKGELIER